MSNITLNIVRHRGEPLALGRNVAVKLLLDKSAPKAAPERGRVWNAARLFWIRPESSRQVESLASSVR